MSAMRLSLRRCREYISSDWMVFGVFGLTGRQDHDYG